MNQSYLSVADQFVPGLVPIVLGVTGHRDILVEDIPRLETVTRLLLGDLEARSPNSPRVVVSCLAEGADRLAARCGLALGWTLGVVLPASIERYEQDFKTQQSKDEFRDLLKLASWVETVEIESDASPNYFAAGVRMMQQSQFLVAFWDGKHIGLKGGTSDITTRFMNEIPDSGAGLIGNTPPDARPVIHVMSRRQSDPDGVLDDDIGKLEWLEPHPGGMSGEGELTRWYEIIRRIDLFNADARAFLKSNLSEIEVSRSYLDRGKFDTQATKFPYEASSGYMFALADAMSSFAQKERARIFYVLAGLATIAIVLEQIFSGPYPSPTVIGLALLSVIIAVLVFKFGVRKRIEDRYLDYRSLAEACRVQHFWKMARIRASVADNFLLEQRDELEWVRLALRSNELSIDVAAYAEECDMTLFEKIRNLWIEDQRHYFTGTKEKSSGNKADSHKMDNIIWSKRASVLFMAGVSTLVLLTFSQLFLANSFPDVANWFVQWSAITYGLLFAAAGLIKVYQETNAFDEHSKSYRRSGLLMQRASQRLEGAILKQDVAAARRIIYETGCEALDENGDWLLLHRDRPVEVPLG